MRLFRLFKIAAVHRGKDPTPEIVDHCAARVLKEWQDRGRNLTCKDIRRAYAMCVGHFQRIGILRKGTMELTAKGRAYSAKHYKHRRALDVKRLRRELCG